ncbi:60S ribosomal protein L36 [Citrus sinensis]|nr:60S ribosomal protein L36 [Citrus sinensis]
MKAQNQLWAPDCKWLCTPRSYCDQKGIATAQGKTSKRVHFERNVIREVSGFAPYEKRIDVLPKVGKDKRALKLAKRKLCTYERAKMKHGEMSNVLCRMRAAGGGKKKK